ncbi:TrmH family RNA methyltransferase [Cellulosilyticum ruminicola]|uniref:TrmH family RNA methyltransferase n=1 Tax=Cellulosilyticum ruminicola TaxID=425254 RepID=UPI0006D277A7|nr:RNA methyltransferase [Cellulosilyticum ruminicola]
MINITSMQNALIKNIVQLQKKKSARKKQGLFVVEGIRAVNEIPASVEVIHYITTPEIIADEIKHLEAKKWVTVTPEIFKAISETQSPQGAMAVVKMPENPLEHISVKEDGFYLVLENLQDPGNLGTIIRTAHAFNVDGVFLTKGTVDLYSPKVVRSTMSSLFHVPVVVDCEILEYMSALNKAGITTYATHLSDSAKSIYETKFEGGVALIIGNEGNGISYEVKEKVEKHIIIPMPGGCESLNASVATSICLYEVMRQRDCK